MKLGYIRVSSQDQNEERQIRLLNEVNMDFIYKEKVSGSTINVSLTQKTSPYSFAHVYMLQYSHK